MARARAEAGTVMMGRTHSVHAEPTTLGLKLAGWAFELDRDRRRLAEAVDEIGTGKISGPVGTYSHLDPELEAEVLAALGLRVDPVSTQIVQRDRHAALLAAIAITGGSLERFATEVRNLQHTEIGELQEPFRSGQKGSSAMPHKRNPILSERIAGLARLLRGYAGAALEDQPLWHERDISHSSAERVILPDATILLDYMLVRMTGLVEGLVVRPERMRENIERGLGLHASSRVLVALVEEGGLSREEAYAIVQRCGPPRGRRAARRCATCWRPSPPSPGSCRSAGSTPASTTRRFLRHAPAIIARLDTIEAAGPMTLAGAFVRSGKVRDLYEVGADRLLLVASDRLSAFDVVLPTPIPDKGRVLTGLSRFWFAETAIVPNHLLGPTRACRRLARHRDPRPGAASSRDAIDAAEAAELRGRMMICRRAHGPARSRSSSAATSPARAGRTTGGPARSAAIAPARPGSSRATGCREPILTPSTKAEQGTHDENIDLDGDDRAGSPRWSVDGRPLGPAGGARARRPGPRRRAGAVRLRRARWPPGPGSSWPTRSSSSGCAPGRRARSSSTRS